VDGGVCYCVNAKVCLLAAMNNIVFF